MPPICPPPASKPASRMSPSNANSNASQLSHTMAANQKISGYANQQHAVDHKHRRRPKPAREKSAHQTPKRHPATKSDHVNAHHAAAQIVGRDQLHQRSDG